MMFVLALLVAIWWLLRKRRTASTDETSPTLRQTSSISEFHAVSIKCEMDACGHAKDLSGQRFLAGAAPRLPLPGCKASDCKCRFIHHKDRRAHKDRRSPFAPGGMGTATGAYTAEQRHGKDRRKDS
jgi:hypothetical protein